ncbi:MAG: hypothetical protein VX589_13925 [Myxococcota bacterium]|nr:hypothetical protein [Myxococcota bacterium]
MVEVSIAVLVAVRPRSLMHALRAGTTNEGNRGIKSLDLDVEPVCASSLFRDQVRGTARAGALHMT